MSVLTGMYLYGIACFVCGVALGVMWKETR